LNWHGAATYKKQKLIQNVTFLYIHLGY
jgi:hypothetical protein